MGCRITSSGAALAFAGCFVFARAHAAATTRQFVDLSYDVDPALRGCPKANEVRAMIAERLGYDPHRSGAPLAVDLRARQNEQGLDGTVRWHSADDGGPAERHFSPKGHDCHELVATMAFVVAVQLELMSKEAEDEAGAEVDDSNSKKLPEAAADQSKPAPSAAPAPSAVAAEPLPSPDRPLAWSALAGIGPAIGVALAPHTAFVGRLFVAAEIPWAALELGAEVSAPTTLYQENGGGFRHQLILGTLAACGRHEGYAACAAGKLGWVQARGLALDKPASPAGLVAQVGPRLAYSFDLGAHVSVMAHVDALYLITPWSVTVNHVVMWSMPRFAAVAGIDVAARFR